jgi:hypothetical protein
MAKSLRAGDKVSWDSSGGHSTGKVVKKQTGPTQIKGHKVAASKGNPEYIVKGDRSGKIAAHTGEHHPQEGTDRSQARGCVPLGF